MRMATPSPSEIEHIELKSSCTLLERWAQSYRINCSKVSLQNKMQKSKGCNHHFILALILDNYAVSWNSGKVPGDRNTIYFVLLNEKTTTFRLHAIM